MTMREQIARAIAKVHYDDDEIDRPALRWSPQGMTRATTPVWQDYLAEADAALAAMLGPTLAMIDAGNEYVDRGYVSTDVLVAMIEAAQQEK